jgi:hypothetical protein
MLTAVLKAVKMLLSCCPKNSQDVDVLTALKAVQDVEKNHPPQRPSIKTYSHQFAQFAQGNLNLEHINRSFITLIPKKDSPRTVNDYRPISLLNSSLKILTKLVANRLQKVIQSVVHSNQYGFIKGRPSKTVWLMHFSFCNSVINQRERLLFSSLILRKPLTWLSIMSF